MCAHSFTASRAAFFGINSSMYGSNPGYVSRNLFRSDRCTDDLTFERAPAEILYDTIGRISTHFAGYTEREICNVSIVSSIGAPEIYSTFEPDPFAFTYGMAG